MTTPTKLEPLPWFAFKLAEYIQDTMRLTTESHGAYLLLMLDYYSTGQPCPDDDFVLAAVAKLPVEQWQRHRKVLAPHFDIREGYWFHKRIEHEMLEAQAKHAASIARATAGGIARWGKRGAKKARKVKTTAVEAKTSLPDASGTPQALPQDKPKQSLADAHLHKHTTDNSSSDDATGQAINEVEEEIGTPVDPAFALTPSQIALCHTEATTDEIVMQVRLFIAYNQEHGTFSTNWSNTWQLWWTRFLERKSKTVQKAPPRVVLNNEPVKPSVETINRQLAMFAKGGPWSHKAFGPEPGQLGCRIDRKLIIDAGIDPDTGSIHSVKRAREPIV